MERKTMMYGVRVAAVTGIFAAGYLTGSVTQRNADADMSGIGSEVMKGASGQGGMVGSVAKLGTAITDMQGQVNGLQKNLEILKSVKASLGK